MACSDIGITYKGENISNLSYKELLSLNIDDVVLGLDEDTLWLILTGHNKKESSIGNFAFELLKEIAKAGENGINTMDLAATTGQDPRSVTGRIKKLDSLVIGVQIIYKGHVVKLLKFHRFANGKPKKVYVNMKKHLGTIVNIVKNSKNRLRQVLDLRRELKFDKDKRLSKAFTAAIVWLDEHCYLKKVIVISPTNEHIKVRCVKYLRDYVSDEKNDGDFENESVGDDEEPNNELDKTVGDDEDTIDGFDGSNATNLLQESNLVIQEKVIGNRQFAINRFFSLQNQTYAFVNKCGVSGVSSMETTNNIVGKDYKRTFSKASEHFIESVSKGKSKKKSNYDGLVKVYDFEGKKKFFRLFTQSHFMSFMGCSELSNDTTFQPIRKQTKTLRELSQQYFVPLNDSLRFEKANGEDSFLWQDESNLPRRKITNLNGKRTTDTTLEKIVKRTKTPIDHIDTVLKCHKTAASFLDKPLISFDGFSAQSLKSIERQRAILKVVQNDGNVSSTRDQFYDDIAIIMNSTTLIDKRTLRRDIEFLVTAGKLNVKLLQNGKRILFIPGTSEKEIENCINSSKESKVFFSKDIIQNTDIYFFDQTEHNRFHRGTKSAQRIKEFQKKTSKESLRKEKKAKTVKFENSVSKKISIKTNTTISNGNNSMKTHIPSEESDVYDNTREYFSLSDAKGLKALVMAVVIIKSIRGQILWEEISKRFPNNSLDSLKKQWTIRRIKMGHGGWKALMEKWRKTMVEAIKNEHATLEDAEKLNISKLIFIWMNVEESEKKKPIILFKSHEENYKRYTFLKNHTSNHFNKGLAMSSMVQRESYLLKNPYTFSIKNPCVDTSTEDTIKSIIRSILIDNSTMDINEVDALKQFNHEQLDQVILDMARDKQISFSGSSKLQLTDNVLEILQTKGDYLMIENLNRFKIKAIDFLKNKKGLLISEEPSDIIAAVSIDLMNTHRIKTTHIPLPIDDNYMHYTTRQYDATGLTPPLVFYSVGKLPEDKIVSTPIPLNKPCSRLWIDLKGEIREKIWKQLVTMIIREIFFNPSITIDILALRFGRVVSKIEINDIIMWLRKKEVIDNTLNHGFIASHNWISTLG